MTQARPQDQFSHIAPLACIFVALLSACAPTLQPLPGPLGYPRSPKASGGLDAPISDTRQTTTLIAPLPAQPLPLGSVTAPPRTAGTGAAVAVDRTDEVSMAIEQTPLPMFIQILYGSVLKKAYSLDPAVQSRTDLVTFKTSQPLSRERMQSVAANLMRSYGLAVQDFDGLVRIVPEANAPVTPILRRGRALPETPEPLRPIFQHVELEVARSSEVAQWLKQMLGTRVTMQDDTNRNGLLLSGTPADLRVALEMVQALDQPRMRGRIARRITPAFANVTDFANRLVEMLAAQGYAASSTLSPGVPILILPIPAISSVVVFTNNDVIMDHTLRWAKELDRPVAGATSNGLFTYAVRYADAQDLAKTLGELLSGGSAVAPSAAAAGAAAPARASSNNRVVVNNATNTLIFRGSSADEYQQIQALLRELDRPSKSALIEVIVAEVRRTDAQSLGVQWDYNRYGVGSATASGSISGSGLSLAITSDSLRVRGIISALASNNLARVLSNPKVMARNGESATIQVGQEVPIITSQQSTGTSSGFFTATPNLLQTVQYRSTGVILKVRPVINSGNRLDLEIQQEVSSAAATSTGVSASPTISTRRVETKLSLRDGSTVLMAGLIDRKASGGNAGVPLLKDIPGLGALFGSRNTSMEETELLVMITPYVINDDYEAEGISDALQASFGDWAQGFKTSRVGAAAGQEKELAAPQVPARTPPPQLPGAEQPLEREAPALAPTPLVPVRDDNDGVTTSKPMPTTAPAASSATSPATPANRPATAVSQPASGARPAVPARAGQNTPAPIKGGQEVEDERVKQEVQKLFEQRRQ